MTGFRWPWWFLQALALNLVALFFFFQQGTWAGILGGMAAMGCLLALDGWNLPQVPLRRWWRFLIHDDPRWANLRRRRGP